MKIQHECNNGMIFSATMGEWVKCPACDFNEKEEDRTPPKDVKAVCLNHAKNCNSICEECLENFNSTYL